jgi:hypothetical protein
MNYITSTLGKLLFPRLPRDLRQRRVNIIYAVLAVGLLVAGGIAVAMLMTQGAGRH